MNNYFNFKIPDFCEKYGSDWDDFKSIINFNVDYLINKTIQLYWLLDPNYFNVRVVEKVLESLDLQYNKKDSLSLKKYYVRKFVSTFKLKGLKATYLNIQENIVGVRGELYFGNSIGSMRWGYSRWENGDDEPTDWKWTIFESTFSVYIDCKTLNDDLLDLLVDSYKQGWLLPAFYRIYLIDSNFNILRKVTL